MFSLVEQYRNSGQTRQDFCREHQLKLSTFAYWITRSNRAGREQSGGFIAVDCFPNTDVKATAIEILYPNGVKLSASSCRPDLIARLIKTW